MARTKVVKCGCGCGEEVGKAFKPGHDAKLKGLLLKVYRGQVSPRSIPKVARERQAEIAFLQTGIYADVMAGKLEVK